MSSRIVAAVSVIALHIALTPGVIANVTAGSAVSLADLSLEELMDIRVTSVAIRPTKLTESPSAIQVIIPDQIERSGVTTIPEALRLASNLNVAQQNSSEWIVSARGFSSDVGNKLLVLMDGRSVYTPLFSGVFWVRQDYLLTDLARIEVVSGPGGTLWGANAVNGVINIVSKHSVDTQGWYGTVAAGNQLEHLLGLRYGGSIGADAHYRVYGKLTERDTENLSDGSDNLDDWSMGQTGFRFDTSLSDRDALTVQGDYFVNETGLSYDEETLSSGGNILTHWERRYSDEAVLNVHMYYDRTELEFWTPPTIINGIEFAPAGVFEDTLDTFDIDMVHRFAWGERQNIVWGVEYRYTHDEVVNAPGLGFFPERLEQDLYSLFVQDEIALLPELLTLTLGTKVEWNDYTGKEWVPNIRLAWNVNDDNMAWGAVSRAVRMPSRIDHDFSQPVPPNIVVLRGDENFTSEEVVAYELGLRSQISHKVLASLSAFYNEYDDVRSTNFTPETILPFYFENNLYGTTHGFELSLDIQAQPWWQLRLGYNQLQVDMRVKRGQYDFNNALNENADPKHQFALHSSMDIGNHLDLYAGWRWVDKLPTNNAGTVTYVPSYAELDIHLAWHINEHIQLSLVGRNLLENHHHEFGVPRDTQEEVGRSIFATLSWRETRK